MSNAPERVPLFKTSAFFEDHGEGVTVVAEPTQGLILVTNAVGRRILELSDGTRQVSDIGLVLTSEFRNAEEETVKRDLDLFLSRAHEKGLVTWQS